MTGKAGSARLMDILDATPLSSPVDAGGKVLGIPLDSILVGRNVRRNFDAAAMQQLTDSVRRVGVLQPILVRPAGDGSPVPYILVCGERRLRAAEAAGLAAIPAVVRDLGEQDAREIQIMENIQRRDLDPIEEALGMRELLDHHGYKQQELAERLGVSQPHIANRLRLLKLPEEVQGHISHGILTSGHAMTLLRLEAAPKMLTQCAQQLVAEETPVAEAGGMIDEVVRRTAKPLDPDHYPHEDKPVFDTTTCGNCHESIRVSKWQGASDKTPFCLNSECWSRKQTEAQQTQAAALREKFGKAAKGGKVLTRDALPQALDSWKQLKHEKDIDSAACEGCKDLAIAQLYSAEPEPVCLNPKCLRRKVAAVTREKNKVARETAAAAVQSAVEWARRTAAAGITKDVLVPLAGLVFTNVKAQWQTGVPVQRADTFLRNRGLDIGNALWCVENQGWPQFKAQLEALSEQDLLALVLEWAAIALGGTWMMRMAMGLEPPKDAAPGDYVGAEDEDCDGDCDNCDDQKCDIRRADGGKEAADGAAAAATVNDPLTKEEIS